MCCQAKNAVQFSYSNAVICGIHKIIVVTVKKSYKAQSYHNFVVFIYEFLSMLLISCGQKLPLHT